jgi:predicted ArsR family transcriptional regulator
MSKSQHPQIRELLKKHDDGLTAKEIAQILNLNSGSVRNALNRMGDVYIDRWVPARQGMREQAVFIWVSSPDLLLENCPRPKPRGGD